MLDAVNTQLASIQTFVEAAGPILIAVAATFALFKVGKRVLNKA